ncbi:MAG TPA: magnesium transporter CorA family protein [Fibrobacteria bacterium]|nr:magnesium transporter CorA family protein [Fibrobacteria bacterium]
MSEPPRLRGFVVTPGKPPEPASGWNDLQANPAAPVSPVPAGRFVWVDVEGELDAATSELLQERLGWHPIVVQNIRQASSRARLTPFEDYTHLVFFDPVADDEHPAEIDAVLGPGYLVTFHSSRSPTLDQLFAELPGFKGTPKSPDLLLHRLVSAAVDATAPRVDAMDDALAALEEEALAHSGTELLERIVAVRDALFLQQLWLAPQLQMLHDLTSGASRFVTPYAKPFFRSTENRLRGLIDDIATYKEVVQNILELYRSAITHKTNETIRVLTVVSTPLLVLSFVTGLYGMNVPLPFAGTPHAFAALAVLCGVVFLGMLAWFRKRNWF